MSLTIPKALKIGETIGFISPSAGPAPKALHRVERAKTVLEGLGYPVKFAEHALQSSGYASGTVQERVSDLHQMFSDPEVRLIMCIIGGNHSNELLKYIDYDLIRENPKIFIGYSDISVLHYALQSQSSLATYYGPCAMTQFGEYPRILDYTLQHFALETLAEKAETPYAILPSETYTEEFLDWFRKKDLERPRKLEPNLGYEWLQEGVVEGPAIGGAILSVNHLAGTKYWCDPSGSIFFFDILFEQGMLNEGAVHSLLTDFDNMGVFDVVAGIIIGRPAGYSPQEVDRLKVIVKKFVKKKTCPILFNVNIGHVDPVATIRYGRMIRLDSFKNELCVL